MLNKDGLLKNIPQAFKHTGLKDGVLFPCLKRPGILALIYQGLEILPGLMVRRYSERDKKARLGLTPFLYHERQAIQSFTTLGDKFVTYRSQRPTILQ